MCMPVIGAVAGIAMSVMSAAASDSAAQADYNAKSAAWTQNVINSRAAARDEQRQVITRQMQEQEKTVQKDHVSYLEQAEKEATAEVSASAGGVSGVSLANILDDISQKSMLNRTYNAQNYLFTVADTQEQLKSTVTRMEQRIASVERPRSPASTVGLALLGGVAKGIGSFASSSVSM